MKKFSLFLSAMLISMMSFAADAAFVFNTEEGLTALGIELPVTDAGNGAFQTALDDAAVYTMDGVGMSVTHKADGSENGKTRIWKKANGALDLRTYKDGGSLTFTAPEGGTISKVVLDGGNINFTVDGAALTDNTWAGEAASVTLVATATCNVNTITVTYEAAPAIEWIPLELEITNLTTSEIPVGDQTVLQLMGRNDMMDSDVMLFLNNYTGEDKAYEVNAESSLVTFGGMELAVMDGSMTKTTDDEKGEVFAGTVHAFVEEDGEGLYVEFALTMYAQPAIEIAIEDVEITVDEESAIATFAATWEGTPLSVEVSGFEAAEFAEYPECWLSIGDDNVWVDAAVGPAAVIIMDGIAMLEGEFTSFATGKSYYVMLTGKLPAKEEPVVEQVYTENKLNTFASGLTSTLDGGVLTVNYVLNNSNATSVNVLVYNGDEVVATVEGTTTIGKNTVEVATAALPTGVELTWGVEVNGTSVEVPTQEAKIYSFYHPSGLDIDNNPENPTFGMLLINEGMHSVKDIASGYVSSGFGAGIFAFTPSLDLIPNGDQPGFNGGVEFTTGRADGAGTAYSPRRIRISEDGRIFVTSLNTDGNYLWEVNPANLNEWTSVFQGTLNENKELVDADSNFVAAPNNGFDVKGAGENLQLAMYSVNLPGITGAAMSGFRLHEYNLGTATTWATAPSKAIVEGKYAINYTGTQVVYDNEGGVWIASYRGTASDANPGLVHINADGVEDAKLIWSNVRQAGIRFNSDFTKLVVAGNNGAAKKATIYAVSKDENGAPVLTEETVIDMASVGNNLNDFAFDYAGNLYACGNSAEKLIGWAMPYSGQVVTPAASKYAFHIGELLPEPTVVTEMVGVVKRALQNGENTIVLTHETDGTPHIYEVANGTILELVQHGVIAVDPENAGDYLAISDIALTEDGKLVAINYMQTQSGDDYVNEGLKRGETRVYIWNDLHGAPSILFTSKMSSNWFRSKQGLTMAVKGTSDNMEIFTTGIHATSALARVSSYRVINGVYEEPAVNHNDHYFFYDVADAVALETTVGAQYELTASPLGAMNWILDAELINPVEIVESESNNVEISSCVVLTQDLGKKYQGTSIVTVGEQVLMVAPYATAEGLLAGVKVLDITAGLDAATEVATADLDAAVEATAAATAVAVAENVLTITLVADAALHTLVVELAPATSGINLTATGLETKLESDGSYTLQGMAVVNGDESNLMEFMLCVYPTEGYTDAFLNNWSVMIFGAPTPGAFVENEDGTFTYKAQIEDNGTVYNIDMSGTIKKSEGPEYTQLEDQITNLTFDAEANVLAGGPSANYAIQVSLKLGNDNGDGTFALSEESTVIIKEMPATFIEGYVYNLDTEVPSAVAVIKVDWDGMYYEFTLTMANGELPIDYMVIEDNITNLIIDLESMAIIGGPSTMWQVEVFLGIGEEDGNGKFALTEESSVAIMGFDARFIDGYAYDIDVNAPAAKVVLHVEDSGFFYEIKLDMTSAAPADPIAVVVENATVTIDTIPLFGDVVDYALKMSADWTYAEDGVTYPVLVEVPVYYPEATEPSDITCTVTIGGMGDNDPWLGFGEGTLTITTEGGVVTAKGLVSNPYTGVAFDVTVSGKLPQGPGSGLDNVQVDAKAVKVIKNGMLIINRDGKEYNAQGAIVK